MSRIQRPLRPASVLSMMMMMMMVAIMRSVLINLGDQRSVSRDGTSAKATLARTTTHVYDSGAARGRGEASPYGWTSKNYVICVYFHCHGTSS